MWFNKYSKYRSEKKSRGFINSIKNMELCNLLLLLCVAFFLIGGLYFWLTGKKGTVSNDRWFVYPTTNNQIVPSSSTRAPPRQSKGEIECRRVLEEIFYPRKFPSERPDFLKNPVTGNNWNLELDCFNRDLRLAVEYNGVQHYKYNKMMHRSHDHFMNQKYRDDMKMRMCKDAGVTLITVPYDVKTENIYNFLVVELKKLGYLS